jgi:hypothetical protein
MDFGSQSPLLDASESDVASLSTSLETISVPEFIAQHHSNTGSGDMIIISNKKVKSSLWERCPAEVRDLIFDEVDNNAQGDYFMWSGRMPSLVVALRGLKFSYKQALQRFAKVNEYSICMSPWNGYSIRDMNQTELNTISMVELQ